MHGLIFETMVGKKLTFKFIRTLIENVKIKNLFNISNSIENLIFLHFSPFVIDFNMFYYPF